MAVSSITERQLRQAVLAIRDGLSPEQALTAVGVTIIKPDTSQTTNALARGLLGLAADPTQEQIDRAIGEFTKRYFPDLPEPDVSYLVELVRRALAA